jgi:hypothetical protein
MDLKLEPCPFCGNTAVEVVHYSEIRHDDECECYAENSDAWAVNCDASGTSTEGYKSGCGATGGVGVNQAEAAELWNQRADSVGEKHAEG